MGSGFSGKKKKKSERDEEREKEVLFVFFSPFRWRRFIYLGRGRRWPFCWKSGKEKKGGNGRKERRMEKKNGVLSLLLERIQANILKIPVCLGQTDELSSFSGNECFRTIRRFLESVLLLWKRLNQLYHFLGEVFWHVRLNIFQCFWKVLLRF